MHRTYFKAGGSCIRQIVWYLAFCCNGVDLPLLFPLFFCMLLYAWKKFVSAWESLWGLHVAYEMHGKVCVNILCAYTFCRKHGSNGWVCYCVNFSFSSASTFDRDTKTEMFTTTSTTWPYLHTGTRVVCPAIFCGYLIHFILLICLVEYLAKFGIWEGKGK